MAPDPTSNPAFAAAHLRRVDYGPDIEEYLRHIDATLVPFGGRFRVHGGPVEVLEGEWPGDFILIEFPDRASARAWYDSPAYRAILPLRTRNAEGDVFLVDAVPDAYQAADRVGPRAPARDAGLDGASGGFSQV